MNVSLVGFDQALPTGSTLLDTTWYGTALLGLTWAVLRCVECVKTATRYRNRTALLVFVFAFPFLTGTGGGLMLDSIACAQTKAMLPVSFQVASIKPSKPGSLPHNFMWRPGGRLDAINISVGDLILDAYDINWNRLVGLPSGVQSQLYTIHAVAPSDVAHVPPDQMLVLQREMLQSLLAERFNLKVHRSTRQLPVYDIVLAKGGAKLKPVSDADLAVGSSYRRDHPLAGGMQSGPGSIIGVGQQISDLVGALSGALGRVVIDKTGLTGRYEFKLTWTPSPGGTDFGLSSSSTPQGEMPADMNFSGPSIFVALEEQLGLKLKSATGPLEVLVVDHIEPPTPD